MTRSNCLPKERSERRILYVTDGFAPFVVGGMQVVARRQIETLAEAGFNIVSISSRTELAPHNLSWQNHHIPWPQKSRFRVFNPMRYVNELRAFSVCVACLADSLQPDCIYSEGPLIDAYLGRPRQKRVLTIFHPHGLEMFQRKGSLFDDLKSFPLRDISRFHARRSDLTISLSEKGKLVSIINERLGVPINKMRVLRNAAPSNDNHGSSADNQRTGRFLFIGRDEPRKGVPLLLRALATFENLEADLVGIPPDSINLPSNVKAHGVISDRKRINDFYLKADFLIVPSYAEGLPTVILEAFSHGMPVIATDVGAVADLVRNKQTGFLIPPNNVQALIDVIDRARQLDDKTYRKLQSNALALANGEYSRKCVDRELVALFDTLLNTYPGAR